jgi:hypothetical protein
MEKLQILIIQLKVKGERTGLVLIWGGGNV